LAVDISAGTGRDLSQVVMALGKASDGSTAGLARLGVGLDKATLATGDMDLITQIEVGDLLVTVDGSRQVKTLENVKLPADTQLYNFVMGGDHTYFVSDYCVTGFLNGIDFDYRNWKPNGKPWTANDYREIHQRKIAPVLI
jgi:hypothetical protein